MSDTVDIKGDWLGVGAAGFSGGEPAQTIVVGRGPAAQSGDSSAVFQAPRTADGRDYSELPSDERGWALGI
jgi:hypothetical protein